MQWLIEQQAFAELKKFYEAIQSGAKPQDIGAFFVISPPDSDEDILSIAGDVATIEIKGALRNVENPWWGTGYPDIIDAINRAESNDAVRSIDFKINSPGGTVSGLFNLTDRMAEIKKPSRSLVDNMAASAAYAIASQTDEIIATNRVATFGSIGVVQFFFTYDDEVTVTSSEAPNKAPDPTTKTGKAEIVRHLDELHSLFVEAIADGRTRSGIDMTADDVNSGCGRGGVFLAEEAVNRGMADRLDESPMEEPTPSGVVENSESAILNNKPASTGAQTSKKEVKTMDLAQLKAEHPELHRQCIAEGMKQALKLERDRVSAHLTYGESSGAMDVAIKAVMDGEEVTETLKAKYYAAGMNNQSLKDLGDDDAGAPEGSQGNQADEMSEEAMADAVFAQVNESLGIEA